RELLGGAELRREGAETPALVGLEVEALQVLAGVRAGIAEGEPLHLEGVGGHQPTSEPLRSSTSFFRPFSREAVLATPAMDFTMSSVSERPRASWFSITGLRAVVVTTGSSSASSSAGLVNRTRRVSSETIADLTEFCF